MPNEEANSSVSKVHPLQLSRKSTVMGSLPRKEISTSVRHCSAVHPVSAPHLTHQPPLHMRVPFLLHHSMDRPLVSPQSVLNTVKQMKCRKRPPVSSLMGKAHLRNPEFNTKSQFFPGSWNSGWGGGAQVDKILLWGFC